MSMICLETSEYRRRQREERREAVCVGLVYGAAAAVLVAVLVGTALDTWRVRNHERLVREATAVVDARLRDCQDTVQRIAGAPYADVSALKSQIDGVRR